MNALTQSPLIEPSRELRDTCAIVGTATSRLGKVPGTSSLDLMVEAIRNALDDAGLKASDVDGVLCRGPDDSYSHHQLVAERLGVNARFSTTLTNGGASQIMSVALAVMAIRFGLAKTIVCGFARDTWSRTHANEEVRVRNETRPEAMLAREFGPEYGYYGATAAHAFGATRHMHLYGTTRDHFGEIAVAFREHALRNPQAQMKKPLSIEDYHAGRLIVAPFGIYDCSLRSDAAGAGLGPQDVDTAQIYDCFTYMVLTQLEDYGFCKKGEGGPFVASGALRLGGALPCNTSGGQLSESHCEGMLQIVEGVRQMRHTYPEHRQVKDAEIALISGHGGNQVCHSTLILGRA